ALVALILLLGGAFALTTGRGGALPVVPLPQLVGTSVPTARSSLQKLGLDVRIAPARHATTASGTVARIRPSSAAALGSVVTITPSSGPRRIEIPPVFGLSSDAASSELAGLGFVVRTRTSYASSPQATAVGTTPAAGTPAPPHSPVELIISAGPAPVAPPPAPAPGKAKDHAKDTGKGKHHKKHE
ncbi:MAG: eukaryotic-like serine/threonine-protein kinase, partial [Gaiellales bacterium]|nr:eukaryotic-like serine/threonine-protein kinase [Gaiellales bacterium]